MRGKVRRRLCKKRKLLDEARDRLRELMEIDPASPELNLISAIEIQSQLQRNGLSPLQALRLYQKKVLDALLFNGVCDIIEDAEETVKSVSPDVVSPIRGMGMECLSALKRISPLPVMTAIEDRIKVLRSDGVVPFVTTAMSPSGLCLDGSTDIFGKQRNPHDPKRLIGGISSGEALLISKGGNIRLFAALCGICAVKPTSSRLFIAGVISLNRRGCPLCLVYGPTSLLVDSMRVLLTPPMFDLDPRIPPIMFREEIFVAKDPLGESFPTWHPGVFTTDLWQDSAECFLVPVSTGVVYCTHTAFPCTTRKHFDLMLLSAVTFLFIYNTVDYPAGVVPVRNVSEIDVEVSKSSAAAYKKAGDFVNAKHAELQSDTKGLPLVVQVVLKPLDEETVCV
ncbi:hypothetical protein Aperf_G00000024991 [Anoplocephala perfoliata]